MGHMKPHNVVSRRSLMFAMGATATGLYACGGGGATENKIDAKTFSTLSMERFATSSNGAAAVLKNQAGGTVALWVDPGTGALTQGLYNQGESSARIFYDTNEQPSRIVNEKTGEFLTVKVVDNSRTDYNLYTPAGAWMDGFAILSLTDGGYAVAKIVSSSSLEGKRINADLAGAIVASLSMLPIANSGIGSPVSIVNSSAVLALSASVPKKYAVLNRLTDMLFGKAYAKQASPSPLIQYLGGTILAVGGILLIPIAVAEFGTLVGFLLCTALVAGGAYLVYRAATNASGPIFQDLRKGVDRIMNSSMNDFSEGSTSFGNTSSAISGYLNNDASMRDSLTPLSSILSTVGSTTSAAASALTSVATSAWQQITSTPPPGLTNLAGLMVDSSGQTYQARGIHNPSGNSYTFTATNGNNQANGSGTVGGNGTYSMTQNGVTNNGTLTSSQQPLGACQTELPSGTQGVFTEVHDLGRDSGTFPLTYRMYGVPTGLEVRSSSGTVLFSTGGLVSDEVATVNIPFSDGRIVFIVLSAPNADSHWKYSVGCPA